MVVYECLEGDFPLHCEHVRREVLPLQDRPWNAVGHAILSTIRFEFPPPLIKFRMPLTLHGQRA